MDSKKFQRKRALFAAVKVEHIFQVRLCLPFFGTLFGMTRGAIKKGPFPEEVSSEYFFQNLKLSHPPSDPAPSDMPEK